MESTTQCITTSQFLRDELLRRQAKNPAYSVSAFARDLGMSQPYVSLILAGKRNIPAKRALELSTALKLEPETARQFVDSIVKEQSSLRLVPPLRQKRQEQKAQFIQLELDRFRTISQWYSIAILDLTGVRDFRPDPEWIAKKLGITPAQVKDTVERLERLGVLEIKDGRWTKTNAKLAVATTHSDAAIRSFHRQMIEKARDCLVDPSPQAFKRREIAGSTLAVNPKRIAEAKKMIQDFRKTLTAFLSEGECTELYQLNTQLFPLTEEESSE